MDIKFTNQNIRAYMEAVKDCNERGKFRLSGTPEKPDVARKPDVALGMREISDVVQQNESCDLRIGLLAGLRSELIPENLMIDVGNGHKKQLSDSGQRLAERKLADFKIRLGSATDDLDAAEVKQILTELKTVKDQVVGLSDAFSDWLVDDDPRARENEEEWQSVVRGHNSNVKPTVGQKNLLIYGKTDALARALDLSEDEVVRLNFDQFEQLKDGTITFRVSGNDGVAGGAFESRTVRLTVGGFIEPADDHRAERDELNKLIADSFFAFGLENPAASFRASDLNDVKAFLRFFAPNSDVQNPNESASRFSVFNMLPDALRLVHDLRRQGKISVGPISPETWWKCLGLKGKFPGGKGAGLARAFNAAVLEKVIDDFLEAKEWNSIKGMKEWLASGFKEKYKPVKWSQNFVDRLFGPFCATTGSTYSQKLALLKTKGCALSDVNLFFRLPRGKAPSEPARINASRYQGVKVRVLKDGVIPTARGSEGAWDSFVVQNSLEDYETKTDALLSSSFSKIQIGQIFKIVDANPNLVTSLGVESPQLMMKVDVEKSGADMLLTIRQPAFRPISGEETEETEASKQTTAKCKYEFRADDLVSRYVVRKDGSYEMTGLSFEKVRESARIVDKPMSAGVTET